jgi:hypothetical protein
LRKGQHRNRRIEGRGEEKEKKKCRRGGGKMWLELMKLYNIDFSLHHFTK